VLAHAVRFNAATVPDAVRKIGAALGDPDDAPGAIDRLRTRLGLPATLSECGVGEDDLDAVARMAEGNGNVRNNPRPVSEADARALLEAAH
jgi:alcohol dehydrogenase class IV